MRPALILLIVSTFLFAQQGLSADAKGCNEKGPLHRHVSELNVEGGTVLSALYTLGYRNGICFGVEIGDKSILGASPRLHERDLTVYAAVQKLLPAEHTYRVREDGGFILIEPAPRQDRLNWLDQRISRFKSARMPLRWVAEFQLKGALEAVRNPRSKGMVGSTLGASVPKVGPFDERDKTVQQLLGLILSQSRGGMWIAFETSPYHKPDWAVIEYGSSLEDGILTVGAVAQRINSVFP